MPEPTLEDYLAQLRTHPAADVRRNAAWVLGRQRDPRILPALLAAVKDTDEAVRLRVAEALGAWRDDSVVPALQTLIQDSDADVRTMAAQSIGQGAHLSGLDALLTAANDPESDVRVAALEALGKLADPQAADVLSAALVDEDSLIRFQAQQSFLAIPAEAAQSALLSLLPTLDADSPQLASLIETLGRIGDFSALPVLTQFATHQYDDIQDAAAWAIDQIKNRGA
jgi:HEAT repeat protein